jgi:hypothetical protein
MVTAPTNITPTTVSYWEQKLDEDVSASITQTWTDQAIKCYMSQANCATCSIPRGGYSFICQMNKVVPVLLKTLGTPPPRQVEKLRPFLSPPAGVLEVVST